jgi:hypothetical protein
VVRVSVENALDVHVDPVERVVWAVNEDDVDLKKAQAAVESLADDLQDPADVPEGWILEKRFGIDPVKDVEERGPVDRLRGWWPWPFSESDAVRRRRRRTFLWV